MTFSLSFQLRLLVIFYTDKDFFLLNKEYIKLDFFNSLVFQWLFNLLERYFEQYKLLPTRTIVEQELLQDKELIILPEEEEFLAEFLALIIVGSFNDSQYIRNNFGKFVKSRTITRILNERSEDIETGNFEDLSSSLRSASKLFESKDTNLLDKDKNVFSLYNLEEIYQNRGGIKTGIGLIDNIVGGLMPKELSVILADTNVGKSLLATYIGGQAIRQMRKVLHVTLEMSMARSLIRYFTTLSDPEDFITFGKIHNFSPEEDVYSYILKLREKYEGYLYVEEFPPGTCTIETLYRLLDKYDGIELLIVDYLDLMKPSRKRDQLRYELSDVTTGLRAVAAEYKVHVMTPTQANRLAAGRRIVGKEVASEDYGKMRIADFAISIGQNADDVQKHEAVLFLARSRNSEKNYAERYLIDFQTMQFRLIRQELVGGNGNGLGGH